MAQGILFLNLKSHEDIQNPPVKQAFELGVLAFDFEVSTASEMITVPETNIACEHERLVDEISFWDGLFSGANC